MKRVVLLVCMLIRPMVYSREKEEAHKKVELLRKR